MLCKKCGGSGFVFKPESKMTRLQKKRRFSDSLFGRKLTKCTGCRGTGCTTRNIFGPATIPITRRQQKFFMPIKN